MFIRPHRASGPKFAGISEVPLEYRFVDSCPSVCLRVDGADADTYQEILGKDNRILMSATPAYFFSTLHGTHATNLGYPKTWKQCSLLLHLINASGDVFSAGTRSVLLQGLLATFREKVMPTLPVDREVSEPASWGAQKRP